MDKLEKALQKARAQREAQLQQQVAEQKQRQAEQARFAPVESVATSSTEVVKVQEGYLERYHVVAHQARSKEADIYRILRTQVLHIMAQSGFKTLGITSANYGDGKTTTALNLAVSIALDLKQTVLLVDLDLRKPNVTEYLGIVPRYGVTDYFLNDTPISECLLRPSFDRLTILPAGQMIEHSSELLGSPKIAALANELKTRYADRIIIYDMPPVLAQDDPIAFLPQVDAVLLVVNDGVTQKNEVKRSLTVLSGANVIGTVLNNSGRRPGTGTLHKLADRLRIAFGRARKTRAAH